MHISAIITPLFIGYPEIIMLVILALVFFGGKKIPELMRGMGRGVKEFKDAVNKNYSDEDNDSTPATEKPTAAANSIAAPAESQATEVVPSSNPTPVPAKRRGRPKKSETATDNETKSAQPKRRGRPKKQEPEDRVSEQPKRRGRPKKIQNP